MNDRLAVVFEREGAKYLKDPWAARNDYIKVILDRREETIQQYFSCHGARGLTQQDWFRPLRLLEMARHTLLMYTSCGWFFTDLSGIETIQVMKYAARALQLGQRYLKEPLEEPFLQILEKARSNIDRREWPADLQSPGQAGGGGLSQGGQPVGRVLAQRPGALLSQPYLSFSGETSGSRGPHPGDPGVGLGPSAGDLRHYPVGRKI